MENGKFETLPVAVEQVQPKSLFLDIKSFEDGWKMAGVLAKSQLIPQNFRGKVEDCVIALELAQRIGASPIAVLQNTYMVHGKPGYSAQFIIAMINSSGKYSPLRFRMSGEGEGMSCVAWAFELLTREKLEGPPVSIETAKKEGWYQKNGSKWQTMPELMLRYRAATFFGRMYAPELLMGMRTAEELHDTTDFKTPPAGESENTAGRLADLRDRFDKKAPAEDVVEIDPERQVKDHVDHIEKQEQENQSPPQGQQESSANPPQAADQEAVAESSVSEAVDETAVKKETAKIDKCKDTIAVDRWRQANMERIYNEYNAVTADAIAAYASDIYEIFKRDESE